MSASALTITTRRPPTQRVDWAPDGRHVHLCDRSDRDLGARRARPGRRLTAHRRRVGAWEVDACNLAPGRAAPGVAPNEDGYRPYTSGTCRTAETCAPGPTVEVISGLRWAPTAAAGVHHEQLRRRRRCLAARYRRARGSPADEQLAGRASSESLVAPSWCGTAASTGWRSRRFLYVPRERPSGQPLPCCSPCTAEPEAQARPNFNPIFQYSCSGYAVLAPNVRGSSGYGKGYARLDDVGRRMDAVKDLEARLAMARRVRPADPGRVAISGGSYGGFMVLAALVTHPSCGPPGSTSSASPTSPPSSRTRARIGAGLREAEYGDLERDADLLRDISPIHRGDRIRAPLMVLHGANDPRVPVGEAEQIVASLRARGAAVEYLRLEDEGHGLTRLENRVIAYPAIADFLDRSLSRSG